MREPVHVTETKRYGNCHGVKKEGTGARWVGERETEAGTGDQW